MNASATPPWALTVIDRPERHVPVNWKQLTGERVLVTGSRGSLGSRVMQLLIAAGVNCLGVDRDPAAGIRLYEETCNLVNADECASVFAWHMPTVVLHLAGAKHAPAGEEHPGLVIDSNVRATEHVLDAATSIGARVVTASTCKACDPETAYGASKLLAERATLARGGTVVRFHNVPNTTGNVFEIWRDTPDELALPVAVECSRYFITREEAVSLALWALTAPPARYMLNPGEVHNMGRVARRLYPGRLVEPIAPRRGDRQHEPLLARSEHLELTPTEHVWRLISPHDYRRPAT